MARRQVARQALAEDVALVLVSHARALWRQRRETLVDGESRAHWPLADSRAVWPLDLLTVCVLLLRRCFETDHRPLPLAQTSLWRW